jgi:hypothetical protein
VYVLLVMRRSSVRFRQAAPQGLPGQQRGAVFEAHPGARRFGAALLLPCALAGPRLVGFVVVDPVSSVVPVSL